MPTHDPMLDLTHPTLDPTCWPALTYTPKPTGQSRGTCSKSKLQRRIRRGLVIVIVVAVDKVLVTIGDVDTTTPSCQMKYTFGIYQGFAKDRLLPPRTSSDLHRLVFLCLNPPTSTSYFRYLFLRRLGLETILRMLSRLRVSDLEHEGEMEGGSDLWQTAG